MTGNQQKIVFNTTFHVEEESRDEFVLYLRDFFIPGAVRSGLLVSPRLTHIRGEENDSGVSFALEFRVADLETLEMWRLEESEAVCRPLLEKFKDKVAGFSTVMETIL